MTKEFSVAVVGATGVVGKEIVEIINERKFPCKEVKLLASESSAGEVYTVAGVDVTVEVLSKDSFKGIDIALFAASGKVSEEYAPIAVKAGAVVIDNSSHFRMTDGVPLIVPEVNANKLTSKDKLIANPNCSTIQLMPVLNAIEKEAGIERVVVSTYQAVSGAGKVALDELWEQTLSIFNQKEYTPKAFMHQIAFNCLPQIDVFLDDGYTKEEYKIINESRKILDLPNLAITATAVRVPVFNSHAESVNVSMKSALEVEKFKEILADCDGVEVRYGDSEFPLQIDAAGQDDIFVGRIRKDNSVEFGLSFWVVADNLRKGAALNAVQIAEYVSSNLLKPIN